MKMTVNQVFKLTEKISIGIPGCGWSTGLYRVTSIGPSFGTCKSDREDTRAQTYFVQRIKKDGTPYGKMQGYNVQAFDRNYLDTKKAIIIE
jgi:hypothetical protein